MSPPVNSSSFLRIKVEFVCIRSAELPERSGEDQQINQPTNYIQLGYREKLLTILLHTSPPLNLLSDCVFIEFKDEMLHQRHLIQSFYKQTCAIL